MLDSANRYTLSVCRAQGKLGARTHLENTCFRCVNARLPSCAGAARFVLAGRRAARLTPIWQVNVADNEGLRLRVWAAATSITVSRSTRCTTPFGPVCSEGRPLNWVGKRAFHRFSKFPSAQDVPPFWLLQCSMASPMTHSIQRLPSVQTQTGYSRSTIYLQISEGLWPRPVKLGVRAIGWPSTEVSAVIGARIAGKSAAEIKALVQRLEAERKGMTALA